MGLLSNKLGIRAFSLEDPSQPLLPPSALFESLGLGRSDAGVLVNERQAYRSTPIFGCFKVISEDLSKIPLSIYKKLPDGSVRLASEHPVHKLIHDQPNQIMTATTFRAAIIVQALAYGNAFAYIERDAGARPLALHLLQAAKTSAIFVNGEFCFATTGTTDGSTKLIDPDNCLHIIGLSEDGIHGFSPVTTCKNAVGLALASEKYQSQFFANGARATGVLSHPEHLDAEAYENLKKSVRDWATGENALRPIILEEGLKWEQISIAPADGQVIQTRRYQVEELSRLYRVPLHKLGELSRTTMNNVEHQAIEHRQDALQPWAVKIEQEINRKLLTGRYFAEHDFSELERGDSATIWSTIQTGRNIGVLDTNDCLRRAGLNPISEEEGGNVRTVQGAFIPLTSLVTGNSSFDDPANQDEANSELGASLRQQVNASYRRLFRDAVGRALNRNADARWIAATLQPIVASMQETINVAVNGIATLTEQDEVRVRTVAANVAANAASWTKANASQIATDLAAHVYEALRA